MTRTPRAELTDMAKALRILQSTGVIPRSFRPPEVWVSLALGTVAGFAKGNFLILLACVAAGALFTIWLHRYLIRTVWLRGDQPSPFGSYRAFLAACWTAVIVVNAAIVSAAYVPTYLVSPA